MVAALSESMPGLDDKLEFVNECVRQWAPLIVSADSRIFSRRRWTARPPVSEGFVEGVVVMLDSVVDKLRSDRECDVELSCSKFYPHPTSLEAYMTSRPDSTRVSMITLLVVTDVRLGCAYGKARAAESCKHIWQGATKHAYMEHIWQGATKHAYMAGCHKAYMAGCHKAYMADGVGKKDLH